MRVHQRLLGILGLTLLFILGGVGRTTFLSSVILGGTLAGLLGLSLNWLKLNTLKGKDWWWWFWLPFVDLVLLGGLGFAVLLPIALYISRTKIHAPKLLMYLAIFLGVAAIYGLLVAPDWLGVQVLVLYTGGLYWWWLVYLQPAKWEQILFGAVVATGFISLGLYAAQFWGLTHWSFGRTGLIIADSAYENHYHWGDWWLLIGVMLVAWYYRSKQWVWLGGFIVVLGVIYASQSRAALVGLLVGVWYVVKSQGKIRLSWWLKRVFWVLVMLVYFGFSLQKSIFNSRPYYIQALVGLWQHPLGVGLGNFGQISQTYSQGQWLSGYASIVHNIALEFVAGLGWLGWGFLVWLIVVFVKLEREGSKEQMVFRALLWALTVNFMLTSTYIIPSFVWVWFMLFGMAFSADEVKGV